MDTSPFVDPEALRIAAPKAQALSTDERRIQAEILRKVEESYGFSNISHCHKQGV